MPINLVGALKKVQNEALGDIAERLQDTFKTSLEGWKKDVKKALSMYYRFGYAHGKRLSIEGATNEIFPYYRSGKLYNSTGYRLTYPKVGKTKIVLKAKFGFMGSFRQVDGKPYPVAISEGNYQTQGWLGVAFRYASGKVEQTFRGEGIRLRSVK